MTVEIIFVDDITIDTTQSRRGGWERMSKKPTFVKVFGDKMFVKTIFKRYVIYGDKILSGSYTDFAGCETNETVK